MVLALAKLTDGSLELESLPDFIDCNTSLTSEKQLAFSRLIYNYWDAKDDVKEQSKLYRQISINRKISNLFGEMACLKKVSCPLSQRFYIKRI